MTKSEIFKKEHELLSDAFCEWILALEDEKLLDGLWYVNGVVDLVDRLIKEDENGK